MTGRNSTCRRLSKIYPNLCGKVIQVAFKSQNGVEWIIRMPWPDRKFWHWTDRWVCDRLIASGYVAFVSDWIWKGYNFVIWFAGEASGKMGAGARSGQRSRWCDPVWCMRVESKLSFGKYIQLTHCYILKISINENTHSPMPKVIIYISPGFKKAPSGALFYWYRSWKILCQDISWKPLAW